MNRRTFLGSSLLTGMALAGDAKRPPNVVMIVGDDMAWTDFGFLGHKVIRTPRIDKLASESAVYPHAYTPTSLCRASLATLLTGMFPHQHRICCNDPPDGVDRSEMHPFMKNAPAIPRLLGRAGYRSLQTGKFWEGDYTNAGFTHGQTTDKDRHIAMKTPQIGRTGMQPIFDFIDASGQTPFFVWYAPMMPHTPHTPPERLLKKYDVGGIDHNIAKYYAMCEWFDETVGQLLDHLDGKKLRDNTLVLFAIDNGWIQYLVKEKPNSAGAPRAKRTPYDMGIRTPALVRLPGRTKAGTYNDLVSTIDFAPTILEACGQRVPREMQGLSLLGRASGGDPLKRDALFGEIYIHTASKLGAPELDVTHRWVRQGDWKLILDAKTKGTELFFLPKDPQEAVNLSEKEPGRVKELVARIEKWVGER